MKAMSGHYGLYEVIRHSEEKAGPLRRTEGPWTIRGLFRSTRGLMRPAKDPLGHKQGLSGTRRDLFSKANRGSP